MKRAAMPSENEIRENLTDAGCSRDETESILACIRSGDIKAAEKIIAASRKKQLQKLHESQRCIDRLDYLCFQMRSI
jgi:HD superfamily phosphohydrolase